MKRLLGTLSLLFLAGGVGWLLRDLVGFTAAQDGTGAESRRAIGVATFSGMVASILFGIAFVPGLYSLFRWDKQQEKGK